MSSASPPVNGVLVLPGNSDIWSASLIAWTFQCKFAPHDFKRCGGFLREAHGRQGSNEYKICCHLLSFVVVSYLWIPTCIQDALAMAGECRTPRLWRVCGGQGKGGILVRHGAGRVWKSGSEADDRITNHQRNSNQYLTYAKYIKMRRHNQKYNHHHKMSETLEPDGSK